MVKGFKIMNLIFYTSWSTKAWIYLPLTQTNLFSFASIDGSRCQGSNEGLNLFAVSISQKKLAGAMDMSVRTEDAAQALDTRLRLPWEFSYRRDELWQAVTGSHYNIVTLVSHYQSSVQRCLFLSCSVTISLSSVAKDWCWKDLGHEWTRSQGSMGERWQA